MSDVSVIIPSHNARQHIGEALVSVLSQQPASAVPAQVLVIDDSTDDTAAVVEPYVRASGGVVQLFGVPPCTNSAARNVGIERATGRYITFLDADDVWLPDKIAAQAALLDVEPDASGVFCRLFLFHRDLDDLDRRDWELVRDDPSLEDIILNQTVVASAMMLRREALGTLRFDDATNHGEDTIFAATLRLSGRWRLLDRPVLARRIHAGQITASAWHQVWNTVTRVRWISRHADRLPAGLAESLENRCWTSLVEFLEGRYWQRELDQLPEMLAEVARYSPRAYASSFLSRRALWPRWLYRVRDVLPVRRLYRGEAS